MRCAGDDPRGSRGLASRRSIGLSPKSPCSGRTWRDGHQHEAPGISPGARDGHCLWFWREIWRRGARVVESGGLENRYTRKGIEGSNPSLSARFRAKATGNIQLEPLEEIPGSSCWWPSRHVLSEHSAFGERPIELREAKPRDPRGSSPAHRMPIGFEPQQNLQGRAFVTRGRPVRVCDSLEFSRSRRWHGYCNPFRTVESIRLRPARRPLRHGNGHGVVPPSGRRGS